MKKIIKYLAIFVMLFVVCNIFSGCSFDIAKLVIKSYPKIVYQKGEQISLSGLKVETINHSGVSTRAYIDSSNIDEIDMSSSGEKIIKLKKDDIEISFNIYVADHIVENKSQLKETIQNATAGDIIYIKQAEYKPENIDDESLYNIVIDKKLTLIGDGKDKTILHGNFLVGARTIGENYIGLSSFEDVKIIGIGFKLNSSLKNKYLSFEGPYQNNDLFGAIKTFDSQKILVSDCSFSGYSFGINADTIKNLTVQNCDFFDIKICAVKITNDITNSSIINNTFRNIGSSSLVMENLSQGFVSALSLAFNKQGNAGVIVASNVFSQIGKYSGEFVYTNAGSDELETMDIKLTSGSYINNSSAVYLISSSENNLQVGGIVFTTNSFSGTLGTMSFGTTKYNAINQSAVYVYET